MRNEVTGDSGRSVSKGSDGSGFKKSGCEAAEECSCNGRGLSRGVVLSEERVKCWQLESAERNMKIQTREMLAECGRKKWGPELRWRDWPCQLFCYDKRDIGRLGTWAGMFVFGGGGLGSRVEEMRELK